MSKLPSKHRQGIFQGAKSFSLLQAFGQKFKTNAIKASKDVIELAKKKDEKEPPMFIISFKNKAKLKLRYNSLIEFYKTRRIRLTNELITHTQEIELKEKQLENISSKHAVRWKHLQSKTLFFSLLRRFLLDARVFGVLPKLSTLSALSRLIERKLKRWTVFYPNDMMLKIHTSILFVIMGYLIIFFPLDFAFSLDENYTFFKTTSYIVYAYFFFDIVLGFLTAFQDASGRIVDSYWEIALQYMKTWFIWDLIAVLPLEFFFPNQNLSYKGLLKAPRLLRIINTVFQSNKSKKRSDSIWAKITRNMFSSANSYYALKSLFITMLFVHIAACIWISLLSYEQQTWYTKYSLG